MSRLPRLSAFRPRLSANSPLLSWPWLRFLGGGSGFLAMVFASGLIGGFVLVGSKEAWAFRIPHPKDRIALDITLTSAFEYHTFNPVTQRPAHALQYFDLQNKLNLNFTYNDLRIGGRFDTFHFFDDAAPCPKTFPDCKGAYIPEKIYLQYRIGGLDLTLGDFYLTLGRGIALSIRKLDEFGLDTTLRGARVSFQKDGFEVLLAGGFANPTNFEPIQELLLEDTHDFFFASRVSQRFLDLFAVGVQYVHSRQAQKLQGAPDFLITSHIPGVTLHFPRIRNVVEIYAEGDVLVETLNQALQPLGYAIYANLNAYFFPFTLQIEGQWYSRYRLQNQFPDRYGNVAAPPLIYVNQPTMERNDLDTQGDNANSKGARIRLDYTLANRLLTFHANYLFRYGFTPVEDAKQLQIHHVYGGLDLHTEVVHLAASAGLRMIQGFEYWRLIHTDLDISIRLIPRHSIEVVGRYWNSLRGGQILDGVPFDQQVYEFHIVDAQIGYTWAGIGSVAFLFSFSNENRDPSARQLFFAGELKLQILEFGYIRLFYGAARGGLRCISGLCRVFPAFEGFRAEVTFRF